MTAMIGSPAAIGPSLDVCSATAEFPLGSLIEGVAGKAYRYVQFVDAVAYVAGHLCTIADTAADEWKVTNDRAGGSAMAKHYPVGFVFQATVPTANQYGWVQCGGVATAIIGSAAVIAGDELMADATEDGEVEEAAAGTDERICAIALATIADNASGKVLCRGMRY